MRDTPKRPAKPQQCALLIAVLLYSLVGQANSSAQPFAIGATPIPAYVDTPTKGLLIDYYQALQSHLGWTSFIIVEPTRRIQRSFRDGQLMGYFPELEQHRPASACRTVAFSRKIIFAHTLVEQPRITRIEQLEGLKIGAVAGYSYGDAIVNNPKLDIEYVNNIHISTRMLIGGRFDAILEENKATYYAALAQDATDKIHHEPSAPLANLEIFMVFQGNKVGTRLCQEMSEAIKTIPFIDPDPKWWQ